jgi:hypothetical protein
MLALWKNLSERGQKAATILGIRIWRMLLENMMNTKPKAFA